MTKNAFGAYFIHEYLESKWSRVGGHQCIGIKTVRVSPTSCADVNQVECFLVLSVMRCWRCQEMLPKPVTP